MNRLRRLFITVLLVYLSFGLKAQSSADVENIKAKLYQMTMNLSFGVEYSSGQEIIEIINKIDVSGKWQDINYQDNTASKWIPAQHWIRLYELALQYKNEKGRYFGSIPLRNAILSGIQWWLNEKPKASNYWWNAIGIPGYMGKVCVLMEKEMDSTMLQECVQLMKFGVKETYYDYHGKATGQNLLWLATSHLVASCLSNDVNGVKRALAESANEIFITNDEGIQEDYSFYQHGRQNYAFGYGKGFAQSAAQLAYLAYQTAFQFPKEKMDILSHYILDGMQWMTRNNYFEYTAMGREIARQRVNTEKDFLIALGWMKEINPENKARYATFYQQLLNKKRDEPLLGNRYFWRSDLMVHQRSDYYFSLKGTSNRIRSGESGNGENIKGFYQGNGTYYLVKRGDEYRDIFPVWDWRKIPGSLCEQNNDTLPLFNFGKGSEGNTSFVYGISNGLYACFGYDYNKDNVTAKRSWFLFDHEIVNLVSNASGKSLYQSINQCWLNGNIWTEYKNLNGNINRVFHDSVGYCITSNKNLVVTSQKQTGSWKDINLALSTEPISREVFSLGINLGDKVSCESYSYTILPGISLEKFKKYRLEDHINILANTDDLQAIYQKDIEQVQAVFYNPSVLQLPWNNLSLQLKKPGLALIRKFKNKLILEYCLPVSKKYIELDLNNKTGLQNDEIGVVVTDN